MISGHSPAMSTGTKYTVSMARYLPATTPVTVTGEVSSSWSVRLCRSSDRDRMVKIGTATMKIYSA